MLESSEFLSVLGILISSVCTIIVANIQVNGKKRQEQEDERERRHAENARLMLELLCADTELGLVNATALKGGLLNGNVEEAMKKAQQAKADVQYFIHEVVANEI